jgi:hypothetical protein
MKFQHLQLLWIKGFNFPTPAVAPHRIKNIPTPAVPGGYTILFSNTSTAGGKKNSSVPTPAVTLFFIFLQNYR